MTNDPSSDKAANPTPQTVPTMSPTPPTTSKTLGVTIPAWIMQILPVLLVLVGAVSAFAQQRADVEQLKQTMVRYEEIQREQSDRFVSKQIFDLKMNENEKYQIQMNSRFDKLEGLINGLYDRLPKRHEK